MWNYIDNISDLVKLKLCKLELPGCLSFIWVNICQYLNWYFLAFCYRKLWMQPACFPASENRDSRHLSRTALLPEVSNRQRCVFHGHQYSTLVQVQNTVLFLKDLILKKKKKYLNFFSLVSRNIIVLYVWWWLMTENRYMLWKLASWLGWVLCVFFFVVVLVCLLVLFGSLVFFFFKQVTCEVKMRKVNWNCHHRVCCQRLSLCWKVTLMVLAEWYNLLFNINY